MVFSSVIFLFFFLTITLAAYYAVPTRYKNLILLISSLFFFYSWDRPYYSLIMIAIILINYFAGRLISYFRLKNSKKGEKCTLIVTIVLSLISLCFFKYTDLLIGTANGIFGTDIPLLELALPIGISFYTFQLMSYTIDVYRKNAEPKASIIDFGAYITMFPQLIAGPIVRYVTVEKQLTERTHSIEKFYYGIKRFVFGLSKKVIIANSLGLIWDEISAIESPAILTAWLGAICYTFQIYYDFSGYSDMAIGLGSMLGFRFPENFEHPYSSKSVTEFWRRWHISLGVWFREYLYISLGGNRCSKWRMCLNLLLVWALTGLWHGSYWNYLLWGIYFAVLLILEKLFLLKLLERIPSIFSRIYTLFTVIISWVIFANEDFGKMLSYLKSMFMGTLFDSRTIYLALSNIALLIISAIFCFNIYGYLKKKVSGFHTRTKRTLLVAFRIGLMLLFIVSLGFTVGSSYNPFLYFRF